MKNTKALITTRKPLWLITRTDDVGYDEYDSCIVAAIDEQIAKDFAGTLLGLYQSNMLTREVGFTDSEPSGIIHSSFCAG